MSITTSVKTSANTSSVEASTPTSRQASQKTRTPWVVGNWKMNPTLQPTHALLDTLIQQLNTSPMATTDCVLAVAPCHLSLITVQQRLQQANCPVVVYAQDVSRFNGLGAYTGEVSALLLADAQITGALVGHSERREHCSENAVVLQQKISAALNEQLLVIYCVGETLAQREQGQAEQVVSQQLCDIAAHVSSAQWAQMVIAYEPVWAIGTGQTASPQDAQAMHAHIRAVLTQLDAQAGNCHILYGGSVKPENAVELAACPDIDGALVGGASLNANSFLQIAQAFAQAKAAGV